MVTGALAEQMLARLRRDAPGWLPAGGHLVVALSGGGDSMALWVLLHTLAAEYRWHLYPVHVDHRLRPESGEQAAWLAAFLQQRFAARLTVVPVTIRREPGESWEAAARRVRHAALATVCRDLPAPSAIAYGHQRDDQAETVLMRILTGTGIEGLAAIRSREGRIYPLLPWSRQALRAMLREGGIPWVEDPSNADPRWLRNRLRVQVLPSLRQAVNPQVDAALAGLADRAAELAEYLDGQVRPWMAAHVRALPSGGFSVDAAFASLPAALQAVVLGRLAEQSGIRLTAAQIGQARRANTALGGGWRVRHDAAGGLRWERAESPTPVAVPEQPVPLTGPLLRWGPGWLEIGRGGDALPTRDQPGWLAVDALAWPTLWVRRWRAGDRVQPLGMAGHRKLKRIFQEHRLPVAWRQWWPVVVGGPDDGAIVLGVPGLVTAEAARVAQGHPYHLIRFRRPDAEGVFRPSLPD